MDNGHLFWNYVLCREKLKNWHISSPMTADYNWKTVLKTGGIICTLVLVLLAGLGTGMWYLLVRKSKLCEYYAPVWKVVYICLVLISCWEHKFHTIEFQIIWNILIQMNCRKLQFLHWELRHIFSPLTCTPGKINENCIHNPLRSVQGWFCLYFYACIYQILHGIHLFPQLLPYVKLSLYVHDIPTYLYYLDVIQYTATILLPLHLWNLFLNFCLLHWYSTIAFSPYRKM